jgi:hypothetical protein
LLQSGWKGGISYIYSSLLHSRIAVQALAVLMMLSTLLVVVRSARFMRTPLFAVGNFIATSTPFKFLRS